MICLISHSKFPDVLTAFTCARAINNLRSISLGVGVLRLFPNFALYLSFALFLIILKNLNNFFFSKKKKKKKKKKINVLLLYFLIF